MESVVASHEVDAIMSEFDELTKNPEVFIVPHLEKSDRFKLLVKKTFKMTVASNYLNNLKARSLSKLLVDGFDVEQIWQQIEIQNNAAVPHFSKIIPNIKPSDVAFGIQRAINNRVSAVIQKDSDDDVEEDYAFDDDSDSATEMVNAIQKRGLDDSKGEQDFGFEDDSNDSDSSAKIQKNEKKKRVARRKESSHKSQVDDQFFKLSKLEEFLKIEDLKEEKKHENLSENEDNFDMFQDIPSDGIDESDKEETSKKPSSRDLMYEDFFDVPESGDESVDVRKDSGKNFTGDENAGQSDYISDEEMEGDEINPVINEIDNSNLVKEMKPQNVSDNTQKTAFEIEQEKIKRKIQEYEKKMLEPMSWHLTGEVDASSRPIDSLIHLETDFDSNAKQDLIIDATLTEKVESIIKMAIINKAFCDVERKVKLSEDVIAYKKEVALDQSKSKKGLAQVYEEDYLKKQTKEQEEEDPKHKEIKKLMDSLFPELHALFCHIPKPAIPEIKVVSNLPAVSVEEVAPTSVSDVTLLAPEEVKEKSGLVKGHSERTDTDRKRERRKKKVHQKVKEKKKQEKLETKKANPSARMSKLEKLEALKKLKRNKSTKIANVDDGGKIKSSKDFFSRLQDTVNSKGRKKSKVPNKKRTS